MYEIVRTPSEVREVLENATRSLYEEDSRTPGISVEDAYTEGELTGVMNALEWVLGINDEEPV